MEREERNIFIQRKGDPSLNNSVEVMANKTRPDTRPPVADGWAGAEMRVFPLFDSMVTDGRMDGPTDGRTDGQSLL